VVSKDVIITTGMYNNFTKSNRPLIAVVGFTASGKSAFGMHLARQFRGEIIAADAMTVYKKFDIGTAKPTQKEMYEIQHHMINVADAKDGYSVAEFKKMTQKCIDEVHCRGKLPILVGGSGLYVNSILYDYEFRAQPANSILRQQLDDMNTTELVALAHKKGLSTAGIDTKNKRRLIRLIETNGQTASAKPLRENTLVLGIHLPKDVHKRRIENRVDAMLKQGLEAEVRALSAEYGWEVEPMKAIGYREWRAYFEGDENLDIVRRKIITHTMQLVKKQRTWFKRDNNVIWVNNINEAVAYTTTFLNK